MAVIEAARVLFARFGVEKTSVREIAREAGLSKATVYNHFAGKEGVMVGVLDCERALLTGKLRDVAARAPDAPAGLRALVFTRLSEIKRLHHHYQVGQEIVFHLMPAAARALEAGRREETAILREIIERGIREGSFRPVKDPSLAAGVLFSALLSLTFPFFGKAPGISRRRAEMLVDVVVNGLRSGGEDAGVQERSGKR